MTQEETDIIVSSGNDDEAGFDLGLGEESGDHSGNEGTTTTTTATAAAKKKQQATKNKRKKEEEDAEVKPKKKKQRTPPASPVLKKTVGRRGFVSPALKNNEANDEGVNGAKKATPTATKQNPKKRKSGEMEVNEEAETEENKPKKKTAAAAAKSRKSPEKKGKAAADTTEAEKDEEESKTKNKTKTTKKVAPGKRGKATVSTPRKKSTDSAKDASPAAKKTKKKSPAAASTTEKKKKKKSPPRKKKRKTEDEEEDIHLDEEEEEDNVEELQLHDNESDEEEDMDEEDELYDLEDPTVYDQLWTDTNIHEDMDGPEFKCLIAKNVIEFSSVSTEDKEAMMGILRSFKETKLCTASRNTEYRGQKFSHLVVDGTKRTIKVLFAIAFGAGIVSPKFIFDSVEKDSLPDDKEYLCDAFAEAVERSRLANAPESDDDDDDDDQDNDGDGEEKEEADDKEKKKTKSVKPQPFLKGIRIFITGYTTPDAPLLERLVKLCGGEVVRSVRAADYAILGRFAQRANYSHVTVLKEKWLLDGIQQYSMPDDVAQYILSAKEVEDLFVADKKSARRSTGSSSSKKKTPAKKQKKQEKAEEEKQNEEEEENEEEENDE